MFWAVDIGALEDAGAGTPLEAPVTFHCNVS
jgi:hypothetical protein